MTMPPSMQFASKVDAWLAVLMLGGGVLALLAVAPTIGGSFARSAGAAQLLGVAAVLLLSLLLPAWLLLGTRYSLTDDALKVRAGPFRWTVPLAEISSVRPSRSILSAPALSLQRVKVSYRRGRGQGFQLVSPRERERFMQTLRQRVDGAAGHTAG